MDRIEEILDRTVRPGLQADGGDIEIVEFTNDDLKILYQGACGGCPSAMMGTLDAIQGILRNELENEAHHGHTRRSLTSHFETLSGIAIAP